MTASGAVRTLGGMHLRTSDRCSRRGRRFDALLGSLVVSLVFLGGSHIHAGAAERSIDAGGFALGVVGALALLLWRRRPVVMVVIVAAAVCTYLAAGYPPGPSLLAGPISLVLLGLRAPRRVSWAGAPLMAGAVIIGQVIGDGGDGLAIAAIGWSIAAVLAGQLGATRREHVLAERERRQLEHRQSITDERLRIAQDLHDSVAHAMATINVQAGTAAHLMTHQPDRVDPVQVQSALSAIRTASAEVLDELGTILGVLRRDPATGEALADRQPQPGIDRIGELVDRARADGLEIAFEHEAPDAATFSALAGTAAYRLVQEALSNVRQHAGSGARVQVTIGSGAVVVTDDGGRAGGRGNRTSTPGFGLIGMRERVEASGGSLSAEPRQGGGFTVTGRWAGR
jgi:signal transduction histidine kinase